MMTSVEKSRVEILRKTIFCPVRQGFLLALLILGIIVAQGMVTNAEAGIMHLSRACGTIGAQESLTWARPRGNLGAPYKVVSDHYKYNTSTRSYEWQHWVATGPLASTEWRVVAGHYWSEYWAWAKVVGGHWKWNPGARFGTKVFTSVATSCGAFNW